MTPGGGDLQPGGVLCRPDQSLTLTSFRSLLALNPPGLVTTALPVQAPPRQVPKTLDNTREVDETVVKADDEEVMGDEAIDEMASYFEGGKTPKIMFTTAGRTTKATYRLIAALTTIFPNSVQRKKNKDETIKVICKEAEAADFTDVIAINENVKAINALIIIHLPDGPTAHFKLTNLQYKKVKKGLEPGITRPELILNRFDTRIGRRVGRMLYALMPHDPNFRAHRVCTFHNQRDFIFFRHHRYEFGKDGDKVRLAELGPRFTLKMRSLQEGIFDPEHADFEWKHKVEMDTSRRRFFL